MKWKKITASCLVAVLILGVGIPMVGSKTWGVAEANTVTRTDTGTAEAPLLLTEKQFKEMMLKVIMTLAAGGDLKEALGSILGDITGMVSESIDEAINAGMNEAMENIPVGGDSDVVVTKPRPTGLREGGKQSSSGGSSGTSTSEQPTTLQFKASYDNAKIRNEAASKLSSEAQDILKGGFGALMAGDPKGAADYLDGVVNSYLAEFLAQLVDKLLSQLFPEGEGGDSAAAAQAGIEYVQKHVPYSVPGSTAKMAEEIVSGKTSEFSERQVIAQVRENAIASPLEYVGSVVGKYVAKKGEKGFHDDLLKIGEKMKEISEKGSKGVDAANEPGKILSVISAKLDVLIAEESAGNALIMKQIEAEADMVRLLAQIALLEAEGYGDAVTKRLERTINLYEKAASGVEQR